MSMTHDCCHYFCAVTVFLYFKLLLLKAALMNDVKNTKGLHEK